MSKPFTPSPQQEAIFADVKDGEGHTVVLALAGTGKSTTILKSLEHLPKPVANDCLLVAFNKNIAKHLEGLAPPGITVSTLHSYGLRQISRAIHPRPTIDDEKMPRILGELIPDRWREARAPTRKLVDLAKGCLASKAESVDALIDAYDVNVPDALDRETFVDYAMRAMDASLDDQAVIDFSDMIWFPCKLKMTTQSYARVFVDECLPYKMPVLLADGSSLPIGEIVEKKLRVKVLGYDTKTGKQRACKVVGWHKLLNQKPLVKIRCLSKFRPPKQTGNRYGNFVVCTIDHPIWADGKWVKAGNVTPGMTVQIETSAEKTQWGKITSKGKKTLAGTARKKNVARNNVFVGARKRRPVVRGGNGTGMTLPQKTLLEALGKNWSPDFAVFTNKKRASGYPFHYKVDVANVKEKIAVEVDGQSHHAHVRKEQDKKKDALLKKLGWRVFRVTNRRAIQETRDVVCEITGNCPIASTVVSVDPIEIRDWHVYDIEVEGCHDFYANGILVHNCQDLNAAQIKLALKACDPKGRVTAVGDRNQAIYQFRGADHNAVDNVISKLSAKTLGLTTTYRCAKSIVRLAQTIVPEFEAAPGAPEGIVRDCDASHLLAKAEPGDFILSRSNAPLVTVCLRFIREGKRVAIQGRDIGARLRAVIVRANKRAQGDVTVMLSEVERWKEKEIDRLAKLDRDATNVIDICGCVAAISEDAASIDEILGRIDRIFEDNGAGDRGKIVLSSTHKAKGLERDRVWLLADTYMKGRRYRDGDGGWVHEPPGVADRNLWYVAISRAQRELVLVRGQLSGEE